MLSELSHFDIKVAVDQALKSIPDPNHVLTEGMKGIAPSKLKSEYIKRHFSEILVTITVNTYSKYKEYEKEATNKVIKLFIQSWKSQVLDKKLDNNESLQEILRSFTPLITEFDFRAGQMRKIRAGMTIEYVMLRLLEKIGIPCQRISNPLRSKLNRMDIAIPNRELALSMPQKCKFLSCKHTLRGKLMQYIPEQNRKWKMYLVTLDNHISRQKAKKINDQGLLIYVKDEVKVTTPLMEEDCVRKLSDLPIQLKNNE